MIPGQLDIDECIALAESEACEFCLTPEECFEGPRPCEGEVDHDA